MNKLSKLKNMEQLKAERRLLEMKAMKQEYQLRRQADEVVFEVRKVADPYIDAYKRIQSAIIKARSIYETVQPILELFGGRKRKRSIFGRRK